MDYPSFLTELSSRSEIGEKTAVGPEVSPFTEICQHIQGTTSPQLLSLLNLAVSYLSPGEIYCEVGSFQGRSLVGALNNHPGTVAYAIDDFSEFDPFQDNFDILIDNLANRDLSDQVTFYYQSFEDFFADLRASQDQPTIGVYFYDAAYDYRSILMGLHLVKPFLADQALIFLNTTNWASMQQASWDFLATTPECELILNLSISLPSDLLDTSCLTVYRWNRHQPRYLATDEHRELGSKPDQSKIRCVHHLSVDEDKNKNANRLYSEARIFHHIPLLDPAIKCYKLALYWTPGNPDIWRDLGMAYYQKQEHALAIDMLNRSLEINPDQSILHYSFGLVLEAIGDTEQASLAYKRAIDLDGKNSLAYNNLGNLLIQASMHEEAEGVFRRAISVEPSFVGSYINLANLLAFQGQLDDAIGYYETAINLDPRIPDGHYNLAIIYQEKNDLARAERYWGNANYYSREYQAAIQHYRECLALLDAPPLDIYLVLAQCHRELNQFQLAIAVYQEAYQYYPESLELYHRWITSLEAIGETEQAISVAQQGSQHLPLAFYLKAEAALLLPIIYDTTEHLTQYQARFIKGLETLQSKIKLESPDECAGALTLPQLKNNFYAIYQGQDDGHSQRQWSNLIHKILKINYPYWCQPRKMPSLTNTGKIKVGYISSSLSKDGVVLLFHEFLKKRDRDRFEVYCFQLNPQTDHVTEAFKLHSDVFVTIPNDFGSLDHNNLNIIAQRILAQDLHILVFLEVGLNPVMWQLANLRLAPIQCVTWGHPITTGSSTIDYFLSNELMEPPDADQYYTEKLIRLPNLGIALNQAKAQPEIPKTRQDYGLPEDAIIYLCIQSLQKYLPQYDFIFSTIAQQVPNAKFVFTQSHLSPEITQKFEHRLQRAFTEQGLRANDYLIFLPRETYKNYFNFYRIADVFLDTFEFSGCLTTLDSLVYDLPVVTCPGQLMRGRQSYGILTRIGVTETIANNETEYINIAVRLGLEPEWRQQISEKIRQGKSRLYDDPEPLQALESFYQQVVHEALAQPASIPDIRTSRETNPDRKLLLHVGCGAADINKLPQQFRAPEWQEVRLDIDPSVRPDLLGSITDLSAVASNSVDAVYSSHNLEHVYHHEVPIALSEFYRVLKLGGFLLITLPDLQRVAEHVAQGKLEEPLYVSAAGPIAAIDILYGYGYDIARGNHYMAHKTGFTAKTLADKLYQAGFKTVEVTEDDLNLWATATK